MWLHGESLTDTLIAAFNRRLGHPVRRCIRFEGVWYVYV
jgi:hypothetical protein